MSFTGLHVFDETVQLSNVWLNELMGELDWKDKKRAYRVLRATLHALHDRLSPHEAIHLGAQLPMLIRGLYYEGWHMKEAAPRSTRNRLFLITLMPSSATARGWIPSGPYAKSSSLARKISPGEIEDVKHILPADVRALWPNGATSSAGVVPC